MSLARRTPNHVRGSTALILTALLLGSSLAAVAANASPGSVTAVISSPANGATLTRVGVVGFHDGSTNSTCTITSWAWTFGDGNSSTLQNPTHQYAQLGTMSVTLTVTGACGASSTAGVTITVANVNPVASLSAPGANADSPFNLDASSSSDVDGSVVSYNFSWDGGANVVQSTPTLSVSTNVSGNHTATLQVTDNDGGSSPVKTFTIAVAPGALATITVSGVDTMTAGSKSVFDLAGADAHGNAVTLAQKNLTFTAPTTVGPAWVNYTEQGVTGSKQVSVVAGLLNSITVSGPTQLVVNTSGTYNLSGFDQYGNAVALKQSTLAYTTSTHTGVESVCYTENNTQNNVTGCQSVSVVADALASITVTGADSLIANHSATYQLAGKDKYGNNVTLAQSSLVYTAPTKAGSAFVNYTESNVTGSKQITVVADSLATITVSGPDNVVVNTTATFTTAGADQYGNPVPLQNTTLTYTAPKTPGTATVCDKEQGIQGCKTFNVTADSVFKITVTGPTTLVVNQTSVYNASGVDKYGNAVTLASPTFNFTAPKSVGPTQACYTEKGVTGCQNVTAVHDALASIAVTGPDSLVANKSALYNFSGSDQFGNAVPLAQRNTTFQAPKTAGTTYVNYTESGVTGSKTVTVVPDALASITISGPTTIVAGTSQTYTLAGFDQFGNSVALAQSTLTFQAPTKAGDTNVTYTEKGVTGTLLVHVVADVLAQITISGPTQMVVNTTSTFTFGGLDQYGNAVALNETSRAVTAPTATGNFTVTATQGTITNTTTVLAVAAPLSSILIAGPDNVTANSTTTYSLSGFDQYGNSVALSNTTLSYHAPKATGPATVTYTEQGVTGTKAVNVVADVLASITVSGPQTLVVNTTGTYALAGLDQYGNGVPLAQSSESYTAPKVTGVYQVTYTEKGITGSQNVTVTPDTLAAIIVTGPASMVVNTTATFNVSGHDQFGNNVPLAKQNFTAQAPKLVGTFQVCDTEGSVSNCTSVNAIHDALAAILVTGPGTIVVNKTATYQLNGTDQFGNDVPLAQSSVTKTAPTRTGSGNVTYTESGVTGTKAVTFIADAVDAVDLQAPANVVVNASFTGSWTAYDRYGNVNRTGTQGFTAPKQAGAAMASVIVDGIEGDANYTAVHDALASITLTGPSTVTAGKTYTYALAGFDQFGNDVPLAKQSLSYTAPTATGTDTVSYTESNVTGSKTVTIVADALARIELAGPQYWVVSSTGVFYLSGYDQYSNGVPLHNKTLNYTAPATTGDQTVTYTEQGVTGSTLIHVVDHIPAYIVVTGPDTLKAGHSAVYNVTGYDTNNNPVTLDASNFTFTAPTVVGPTSACYQDRGVEGCKTVQVVADDLASIVLTGPDQLVAGTSANYTVQGYDKYGNAVTLQVASVPFTAPTKVGTTKVTYTESGITGSKDVLVVHDALASIQLSGPQTIRAGSTHTYLVHGSDQYGNFVPTTNSSTDLTAPTTTGPATLTYTESSVTGSLAVTVTFAQALAISIVNPPATVGAGVTVQLDVAGTDVYGNSFTTQLPWTAPGTLGDASACVTQDSAQACATITVVPGPLDHFVITASATTANIGRPVTFSAVGYDKFGHVTDATGFTWKANFGSIGATTGVFRGDRAGVATISAVLGTVSTSTRFTVSSALPTSIAMQNATQTMLDGYNNGIHGTVTVKYIDGAPVVGASVRVTIQRSDVSLGAAAGQAVLSGTLDSNGQYHFDVPQQWTVYGSYRVNTYAADALGNTASATATYAVTLA